MLIGAIADDITGATGLCLMHSRSELRTVQRIGVPAKGNGFAGADAVVIALKSRSIPATEALDMSCAAAQALLAAGAEQLLFKYCSTFDSTDEGNIGPVTYATEELEETAKLFLMLQNHVLCTLTPQQADDLPSRFNLS